MNQNIIKIICAIVGLVCVFAIGDDLSYREAWCIVGMLISTAVLFSLKN